MTAFPSLFVVPGLPSTAPSRPPRPRRWSWGHWLLLTVSGLTLLLALAVTFWLDPWLRRTLEEQARTRTHGQYRLQIGGLRTQLWQKSLVLRRVTLTPTGPTVADSLPRLRLRLAHLTLAGVGLWPLLRRETVPLDSLALDSLRLDLLALPRRTARANRPLHQNLPLGVTGLRVGCIALRHSQASVGPSGAPTVLVPGINLVISDFWLSAAAAADTLRFGYAADWQVRLQRPAAQAAGHHFTAQQAFFSMADRRVQLDSVRITPPSAAFKPGAVRVKTKLQQFIVNGLQAAALQHGQQLRADSLHLIQPDLTLWLPAQPPPPLWQLIRPYLKKISLQAATVRDASLHLPGLVQAPAGQHINIIARRIHVDSAAERNPRCILYAAAWTAHTGRLAAAFDPPFYHATVQHLRADTDARSLIISNIAVVPSFAPAEANRRKGHQVSPVTVRLPLLQLTGLDFGRLARYNQLEASRLSAQSPWVLIASDGRGPINPARSVITPEAVRRIPMRFAVRRLDVVGGNLYTIYRSPRTPIVGKLRIIRFRGSLFNLSNDPARQTAATPLTGHATAWLQGRSRLDIHLVIPLLDPLGRHRLWGSFGPAPFAILNPMTAPTRFLRFDHGDLRRIRFQMQADQQHIQGTMQAEYSALKLSLLSYKNGELKKPLLRKIISGAANTLVIRDDNPRPAGRFVVGQTASRRERRYAVFALWRQGLVSGLLHSAGVPQKLAQKLSEGQDQGPLPK